MLRSNTVGMRWIRWISLRGISILKACKMFDLGLSRICFLSAVALKGKKSDLIRIFILSQTPKPLPNASESSIMTRFAAPALV